MFNTFPNVWMYITTNHTGTERYFCVMSDLSWIVLPRNTWCDIWQNWNEVAYFFSGGSSLSYRFIKHQQLEFSDDNRDLLPSGPAVLMLLVCHSPLHPSHLYELLCEWMSESFLPWHCRLHPITSLPPSVFILSSSGLPLPPSTGLPPPLSLGAVWGDGSGFCRWWLHGVYRLTASHAQSSARTHCFILGILGILGILEQDTDLSCCVFRSFRNEDRDAAGGKSLTW